MPTKVKVSWTGEDREILVEVGDFALSFINETLTLEQLIESFTFLKEVIEDAVSEEHASPTESASEVQSEAGSKEGTGES